METVFKGIVHYKKTILVIFAVSLVLSVLATPLVKVNYDLMDYLPQESPSTVALDEMEAEYDGGIVNARVMIEDVTLPEALEIKDILSSIEGVEEVAWLDDVEDPKVPLEFMDEDTYSDYYQDGYALMNLVLEEGKEIDAIHAIKEQIGEDVKMDGAAVDTATATETTEKEVSKIILMIIPICFIVLFLTTDSWFEPVLFMATIGIAILLNKGTNLLLGEISFVTNAAGAILQLAVSMDYAIFLLHRFGEARRAGDEVEIAMVHALRKSVSAIGASGLTTVIGFAALLLMRFKIGPDMGIVMAKAIVLSLLSVVLLLPVLTMYCYKLIDKFHHKSLIPSFSKLGKLVERIHMPAIILFCILVIPAFMAQSHNNFYYGTSHIFDNESTRIYQDKQAIEEVFGQANRMVLLVPKGDSAKERALNEAIKAIPQVDSLLSYADSVGEEIPVQFLDPEVREKLVSEDYTRFVMTVDTAFEGKEAFQLVEKVHDLAQTYYPDAYYYIGETVSTYDLKNVVTADMMKVNLVAIGAIFIILMFTFKSITLPVLLVLVIETSIWLNLAVPYFRGQTVFYIAYLIISSIQLGATVDYAILLTGRYLEERETKDKKASIQETIRTVTLSILTSASILFMGSYLLGVVSTHGVLSQLGHLISRGALISTILVLFVLPGLLYLLDGVIQKTSRGLKLHKE